MNNKSRRIVSFLCLITLAAIPRFSAAAEPAKQPPKDAVKDTPAYQAALAAAALDKANPGDNTPPVGFVALFNGKDLTGWKGLLGAPLDNPAERAKATPETLEKAKTFAEKVMHDHWSVKDGILIYDGKGKSLATVKDYTDFEMMVDWKILPAGDSGIYLRGTPQVQIWDPANASAGGTGSGGLYNNVKGPSKPSKRADKPVGEWNTFWIKMVGDKVWVKLNGEMVVDGVVMENYWLRKENPDAPIFPTGQIELQNHRNPLYFKNIYIKELPPQK
jgi:hypothetical protein